MRFFKCYICGNFVELLYEGGGELVCCGEAMQELVAKDKEEGSEKHLPVVSFEDNKLKVKVGEVSHPMLENHYITCVIIKYNDKVQRLNLFPNQTPEAEFCIDEEFDNIEVYEYCNVHGLWKTTYNK